MKRKVFVLLIVGLALIYSAKSVAEGSQPRFLITWSAETYAPADFRGKIFPTANSVINASFDLIDNGAPADLSNETIYWYVNDKLVENKPGMQKVKFKAPFVAGGTMSLRVSLPNYKNKTILKTVEIPVVSPEAVIEAPFPNKEFSASSILLHATPYFFNALPQLLGFSWTLNGAPVEAASSSSLGVDVDPAVPDGTAVGVGVAARNPASVFESAAGTLNLIFRR